MRAVAYRMLGSLAEAEDAVQDTWVRFNRSGTDGVENLGGWLTTIVARVCLNMLQARAVRRKDSVGVHVPDPIVSSASSNSPEDEALLADSVDLALVVMLDALSPAERLTFVLHDLFRVPFEEIAPMVGRTRPPLASSPAGRVGGCKRHGSPTPIRRFSAPSSTHSSLRRTAVTSIVS